MAVTDGTGLTKAKAFRIKITLRRGASSLDLTGYTVTADAQFEESGTQFACGVEMIDEDEGQFYISGTATQMNDSPTTADYLAIEFTISGSPVINPNAKPLRIPVRPLYQEFVAP